MNSKLLDGKKLADSVFKKVKTEVEDLKNKAGITQNNSKKIKYPHSRKKNKRSIRKIPNPA